jgi:hypothetical protein
LLSDAENHWISNRFERLRVLLTPEIAASVMFRASQRPYIHGLPGRVALFVIAGVLEFY